MVSITRERKKTGRLKLCTGTSHNSIHKSKLIVSVGAIFGLDKYFYGSYREHIFLRHPKVPESVKQSQSSIIDIVQLLTSTGSDINTGSTKSNVHTGNINTGSRLDNSTTGSFHSISSGSTNNSVNGNVTFRYDSGNVSKLTEKFRKFEAHSVIHLSNVRLLDLTLDQKYEDLLNSTIAKINYKPQDK